MEEKLIKEAEIKKIGLRWLLRTMQIKTQLEMMGNLESAAKSVGGVEPGLMQELYKTREGLAGEMATLLQCIGDIFALCNDGECPGSGHHAIKCGDHLHCVCGATFPPGTEKLPKHPPGKKPEGTPQATAQTH